MTRTFLTLAHMSALLGAMHVFTNSASGGIVAIGDVTPDPVDSLVTFSRRLYVGEAEAGSLTIDGGSELKSDGGSLGRFENSSGQVTISGSNTSWDATFLTSPTFHVGVRGHGDIRIEQGAQLLTGHVRVASELEGFGTATVDGPGTLWRNQGIRVGDKSEGHFTISQGGHVVSDGNSRIGAEVGATGSVTVTGSGTTWDQSEYVVMGTGSLHIADGATVNNTWSNVAALSGSHANITVTGMGSQWRMSDSLRLSSGIASANVTPSSTSTLSIQSGGVVASANSASIGTSEGSQADVLIEAVGSLWQHTGEILIGDSGTASLVTRLGGSLTATSTLLGFTATGTGHATVSGLDTSWDIAERLSIGMAGSGKLDIEQGALVSSNSGVIGTLGHGEVTVTDEESRWLIDDELFVGGFTGADGAISVLNEALVEVGGDLTVGYEIGSVGEITISSEATLEVEGETFVGRGEQSMAILTVRDGGVFDADDDVTFAIAEGSHGVLNLEPGGEINLHGHKIQVGEGTPEFNIFGGRLRNVGIFGTHLNLVAGTLAAGNSPGTMLIQGDLNQAENAVLEVELSRLSTEPAVRGRDFDFYHVDGHAMLGGQLNVVSLDGYTPQLGDSFDVLQAETIDATRVLLTGVSGFEARVVPELDGQEKLVLTFVPEPRALAMAWLLLGILHRIRCEGQGQGLKGPKGLQGH